MVHAIEVEEGVPMEHVTNFDEVSAIKYFSGLEIKCVFFQGFQLHLHKLHKGVVYNKQYIFGLPAEI